jgi:uncharacterized protein (TIGR03437 family)
VQFFTLAVLAVAIGAPATAQFRQLATDHSGSRVWFSTELAARGSGQPWQPRIWSADTQGRVSVVAERAASVLHRNLVRPQVSSDGSVIAYDALIACPPQGTCRNPDYIHGIVAASGRPETEVQGRVHVSRNGRWVLRESDLEFGPVAYVEVSDRQTGAVRRIAVSRSAYLEGFPRVTSAGSALIYSNALWLLHPNGNHTYITAYGLDPDADSRWFNVRTPRVSMDDAGTLVAYETNTGEPQVYTVRPGIEESGRLVAQQAWAPSLSADGSRLLFVSGTVPQAWIASTSGGDPRRATDDPAGIAEATLSGDGNVIWAATLAGRIIRVDVASSQTREIVPRTVVIETNAFGFPLQTASGAIASLLGRGLAASYATSGVPLATELGGVRVLANDRSLPLFSVAPEEIRLQVPWEISGRTVVTLAGTDSPFEQRTSITLDVRPAAPSFLRDRSGLPLIVHEDFRGLVTRDDPARPGEVLHLYLTGLGPVTPSVATGEPAPAVPLSTANEPVAVFWQGSLPTNMPRPELLFAGLAPGLIGVYQVDVRVPFIAPTTLGISVQGATAEFPVSQF